jgi:primosomal protein N' (replication factor Y)
MANLATGEPQTAEIEVVDINNRDNYGRNSYFSNKLLDSIEKSLEQGEQSLVFLNRRGTARIVICQNGDWQALCPNCDLPLTYHGDSHLMRCHTCGYKNNPPISCPVCGSPDIIFKSFGTKAIEYQLKRLFPEAKVQRFDNDNAKNERFDIHYAEVVKGGVDILVGTQILVKGLDLPKLSTVGVVAADSSLYFPDYLADEQTYQLLTQVIGRVGRGHRDGRVIIQTHNPSGLALQAAIKKDWQLFYDQQINERRKYTFPPFCFLLKLTCSRRSRESAMGASLKLIKQISNMGIKAQIIGPAPRFIEKINGSYNWQVTVKAKNRDQLIKIIHNLPNNWQYDIDPSNLL